jgi:hypothetical protein
MTRPKPTVDQRARELMTGAPALTDEQVEQIAAISPPYCEGSEMDDETVAAIHRRAKELAEAAPPFTTDQALMLRSVFSRYPADDLVEKP